MSDAEIDERVIQTLYDGLLENLSRYPRWLKISRETEVFQNSRGSVLRYSCTISSKSRSVIFNYSSYLDIYKKREIYAYFRSGNSKRAIISSYTPDADTLVDSGVRWICGADAEIMVSNYDFLGFRNKKLQDILSSMTEFYSEGFIDYKFKYRGPQYEALDLLSGSRCVEVRVNYRRSLKFALFQNDVLAASYSGNEDTACKIIRQWLIDKLEPKELSNIFTELKFQNYIDNIQDIR